MGYKPTENYAAKDFLESGDPEKIVMGRELQADFDAISTAFDETDNKLKDLDYVDLRGDTMTGPLIAPEVIADDFVGGDVSADTVKATGFEGDGSKVTGITVNQLADVTAPDPKRDQVLAYNGSSWESVTLDIVSSDLNFKGPADLTSAVPAGTSDGDMYVNDTAGVVDFSWTGLSGTNAAAGDFVAYSDADSRWFSLGSVSTGAVTSVGSGLGIAVDSLQPSSPVVSVDRADTDAWYADKTDTETELRDLTSEISGLDLRVTDNRSDINELKTELADETQARADGDAELLALIQAARPGSQVTASDDAPSSPVEGDLWYCTLVGSEGLFVWHEGAWLATDADSGPILWKPCDDGTFFDGGSVGVNIDTPYSLLHVDGDNTPAGGFTLSSGANHHTNYLVSDLVNAHDIESSSPDAAHTWRIDGDEKVRIDAAGSFEVAGSLTANGLLYPTTDGTDGQAILTDGNGTLAFGDVVGGVAIVDAGLGIDVDSTNPSEPVVSIDRSETDSWYLAADAETSPWETVTGGIAYNNGDVTVAGSFETATAVAGTETTSISGSTALDFTAQQNFVLTLTGNVTLDNPTTETVGQSGFIVFIQDGTGSHTVSLGTEYETAGGAGLSLSTAASTTDIVPYVVAASGRILLGAPQFDFS